MVPKRVYVERFHTILKVIEPLSNLKHIIFICNIYIYFIIYIIYNIYIFIKKHTFNGMNASVFFDISILWKFGLILDNEAL